MARPWRTILIKMKEGNFLNVLLLISSLMQEYQGDAQKHRVLFHLKDLFRLRNYQGHF